MQHRLACFVALVAVLGITEPGFAEPGSDLTVLTWNVLQDDSIPDRAAALLREIGALQPDIVALQEVDGRFLKRMSRDPVLSSYQVSASLVAGEPLGGVVILTRAPVSRMRYVSLASQMKRGVLFADVSLPSMRIVVAAVHLESNLKGVSTRSSQLHRTLELLRGQPDYLIMGDFNFGDGERENEVIPDDVVDVWPRLRQGEAGCTFDVEKNGLARANSLPIERNCRYDRVLVFSPRLEPLSVEMTGTKPYRGTTHPSDHYGLVARFRVAEPQ